MWCLITAIDHPTANRADMGDSAQLNTDVMDFFAGQRFVGRGYTANQLVHSQALNGSECKGEPYAI